MRPIYISAAATVTTSSAPVVLDHYQSPSNIMIAVELGGNTTGASYSVQYSPDDPNASYVTNYQTNANWYNHPTLVNLVADGVDQLSVPAQGLKIVTNTVGSGGTASPRMVVIQSGMRA